MSVEGNLGNRNRTPHIIPQTKIQTRTLKIKYPISNHRMPNKNPANPLQNPPPPLPNPANLNPHKHLNRNPNPLQHPNVAHRYHRPKLHSLAEMDHGIGCPLLAFDYGYWGCMFVGDFFAVSAVEEDCAPWGL